MTGGVINAILFLEADRKHLVHLAVAVSIAGFCKVPRTTGAGCDGIFGIEGAVGNVSRLTAHLREGDFNEDVEQTQEDVPPRQFSRTRLEFRNEPTAYQETRCLEGNAHDSCTWKSVNNFLN